MEGFYMNTVKVTLNLPEELVNRLKEESSKTNISMTEAIRRGIEVDLFLKKEESAGSKILLEKKDSKIVQLVRK
jgi:hypothetical protein